MRKMIFTICLIFIFTTSALAANRNITFTWTAPSDPAYGNVSGYNLVYSEAPITEANFSSATLLTTGTAKPAGQVESYTFSFADGKKYYFAIKAYNQTQMKSTISNAVVVSFLGPNPITDLSFTLPVP